MSAWVVNRKTIALLTEAIVKYGLAPTLHPDAIGMQLWTQNVRSVNYCYNDHHQARPYIHPGTSAALLNDPYTVYKCARCYDYQSCETPDYETTWASQVTRALCTTIEKELIQTYEEITRTAVYDEAPWGL